MREFRINAIRLGLACLATLGLALPAAAQNCIDSPPGAMAWWPGDGDVSELEGGYDAKLVNGAGFFTGFVGDAFSLDGVAGGQDDQVVFPRMAADGLANMTVELWVNTTDTVGSIFSAANGNDPGGN